MKGMRPWLEGILTVVTVLALAGCDSDEEGPQAFDVYTDNHAAGNHYFASGWMGDIQDLQIDEGYTVQPHSGATCIKVTYTLHAGGQRWAGVYWLDPAGNWGDTAGGYDLTGRQSLQFWARGEKGGEIVRLFGMGGVRGTYLDSATASIGPITLTREWTQYTIRLGSGILGAQDLTRITGGFTFSANADDNPTGFVMYLDDIIYK